jgi:hypothetical protein
VHLLIPADGFQRLRADRADFERLRRWDGTSKAADWTPMRVSLETEELGRPLWPGDFLSISGTPPVFSRRAAEVLGDLLPPNGELLPLACDVGEFLAYNCTTVLDALDEDRSQIARFRTSGRVSNIERHVFLPERLRGAIIFKLATVPGLYTYVTDGFLQRADESGLQGFAPHPIWSSTA